MSFKEIQKEKTAQIEQILKAYLPRVQGYQEVIMDAMSSVSYTHLTLPTN